MNYSNNVVRQSVPPLAQSQPAYNFSQFQSQPIFPQPSGNIYFVNNSMEVANIPIGAGMSAVLCLSENLFYIKSMQNGVPSLLGYKITPLEPPTTAPAEEVKEQPDGTAATQSDKTENSFQQQYNNLVNEYDTKIKNLEESIQSLQDKIGGLVECQF